MTTIDHLKDVLPKCIKTVENDKLSKCKKDGSIAYYAGYIDALNRVQEIIADHEMELKLEEEAK